MVTDRTDTESKKIVEFRRVILHFWKCLFSKLHQYLSAHWQHILFPLKWTFHSFQWLLESWNLYWMLSFKRRSWQLCGPRGAVSLILIQIWLRGKYLFKLSMPRVNKYQLLLRKILPIFCIAWWWIVLIFEKFAPLWQNSDFK